MHLGLPFPLVWPKAGSDLKKSSCALFSSTSGETQLYHIFVPKSLNCSLNWLPSHLSRQKRKNLLAKRKRRLLLARLRLLEISHYKQRRFITTRMPQTESRVEFQGISRRSERRGWCTIRRLSSGSGSVNSGKLFTSLCLSFFICKRGGCGGYDYLSLSGDESKRT